MRVYLRNSPQALARLVAMVVVADGRLHDLELKWLDQRGIYDALGINAAGFGEVLLDLCRDVVLEAEQQRLYLFDPARLKRLAADVDDPQLQRVVLSAMLVVAKADGRLSAGEQILLRFLLEHWNISVDELGRS
ncbi:MAG: hypothetical protein KF909_10890 [Rhodocyclaceae bacterium]|nr:hypothetical protein [Rhodocyclaceae bacterium]MCB1911909.1 hypothetical protein [Rhodocyclaceae bacterium]MCP5239678.1 TerB family tellurite resistance protein [Zoogloeaceae bacterium]MCW5616599.1 hypothetical protein [Rhodocyclaceae bacterium]